MEFRVTIVTLLALLFYACNAPTTDERQAASQCYRDVMKAEPPQGPGYDCAYRYALSKECSSAVKEHEGRTDETYADRELRKKVEGEAEIAELATVCGIDQTTAVLADVAAGLQFWQYLLQSSYPPSAGFCRALDDLEKAEKDAS
jgi:hypothetical protein